MDISDLITGILNVLGLPWVGGTLGVLGILTGYLFYRKSVVRQQLAIYKKSLQIVGINSAMPSDVKLTYKGNEVPRVTKTLIFLLNTGNSTIKGENIIEDDPLRLTLPEGSKILDVSVLKRTRDVTQIAANERNGHSNEIVCSFRYLDRGDGAAIRILHTGDKNIKVQGTIIGIPEGIVDFGDPFTSPYISRGMRILPFIGITLSAIMLPTVYEVFFSDNLERKIEIMTSSTLLAVALLASLSIYLPPIYNLYRNHKQKKFSNLISVAESEW